MKHAHFLCNINDDSWLGHVGTFILLSFGPTSRARLQQYYQELRATPHNALDLDPAKLGDFTVRQVLPPTERASVRLVQFCEDVRGGDDPLPVPQELLRSVLRRADADEELRISRLPIYQQGSLELIIYLTDMFKGRGFLVDGAIDLHKLAKDFPAAVPGSKLAGAIQG